MHRVQFDIDDDLYERALPSIKTKKALGWFGRDAFEERVKRIEARQGRALSQDEEKIRSIVKEMISDLTKAVDDSWPL
jgi:Arc/MetJ family transcription regulator